MSSVILVAGVADDVGHQVLAGGVVHHVVDQGAGLDEVIVLSVLLVSEAADLARLRPATGPARSVSASGPPTELGA